jgi:hypothetical protein
MKAMERSEADEEDLTSVPEFLERVSVTRMAELSLHLLGVRRQENASLPIANPFREAQNNEHYGGTCEEKFCPESHELVKTEASRLPSDHSGVRQAREIVSQSSFRKLNFSMR